MVFSPDWCMYLLVHHIAFSLVIVTCYLASLVSHLSDSVTVSPSLTCVFSGAKQCTV